MVGGGNVFGLRRYVRNCGKFKTYAVILMDNGLGGGGYKGFRDRTVLIMCLVRFDDYRVDLLKQFVNTNQFTHGFRQVNILGFRGT